VGFDDALAMQLLQAAQGVEPTAGVVRVTPVEAGPFRAIAVVSGADSPFHQSDAPLTGRCRWVVPLHAHEMPETLPIKDFNGLIGPAARLPIYDWTRAAQPYCRGRLCTDWIGGMLRRGKTARMCAPASFGNAIGQAPVDAVFECFDATKRKISVTVGQDQVSFSDGGQNAAVPREQAAEALVAWLQGRVPEAAPTTAWFGVFLNDPNKRRSFGDRQPAMRPLARAQAELHALSDHPDGFVGFTRDGLIVQFTYVKGQFTIDVPRAGMKGSLHAPMSRDRAADLLADWAVRGEAAIDDLGLPLMAW
jgi:hypothetical protein